ncbi:MAG: hypothetical protein ACYDD6_04700 [Acidimicrobiales bacterium]
MDIEEFYAEDERRRRSSELELGTEWNDADGARYELSWVADTGEVYVMREPTVPMTEDPFGDVYRSNVPVGEITVVVVGWVPDRDKLEEVMRGWEEAMPGAGSIAWVAERLRANGVPRGPAST